MEDSLLPLPVLLVLLELNAISEQLFSLLTIIMLAYIFIAPKLIERSFRKTPEEEPPELVGVMMPTYARYALDDKLLGDAFNPSPVVPDSAISLEAFFRFWMTPEQTDYVVREVGGKPTGILSLKKVREISTNKWNETSLASLMAPRFPTVHPNEPIDDALEKMVERGLTTVPVVDEHNGELLGELTAKNVYSLLLGGAEG